MIHVKKLYISILIAIVFILGSLPVSYTLSDKVFKNFKVRTTFDNCPGLPTIFGLLIHAFLISIATYVILIYKEKTENPPMKIEKLNTQFEEIDI